MCGVQRQTGGFILKNTWTARLVSRLTLSFTFCVDLYQNLQFSKPLTFLRFKKIIKKNLDLSKKAFNWDKDIWEE